MYTFFLVNFHEEFLDTTNKFYKFIYIKINQDIEQIPVLVEVEMYNSKPMNFAMLLPMIMFLE